MKVIARRSGGWCPGSIASMTPATSDSKASTSSRPKPTPCRAKQISPALQESAWPRQRVRIAKNDGSPRSQTLTRSECRWTGGRGSPCARPWPRRPRPGRRHTNSVRDKLCACFRASRSQWCVSASREARSARPLDIFRIPRMPMSMPEAAHGFHRGRRRAAEDRAAWVVAVGWCQRRGPWLTSRLDRPELHRSRTEGCVCPRQDSNLRHRLRRAVLYPLSYGGSGSTRHTLPGWNTGSRARVGRKLPVCTQPPPESSSSTTTR